MARAASAAAFALALAAAASAASPSLAVELALAPPSPPRATAGGADLCVLFISDKVRGFHFGRVDFKAKQLVDLVALPPELEQANGGVAAGADEGVFYIPAEPYGNDLYELNIRTNKTALRTVAPPPEYKGSSFAFGTMQVNDATGDIWALLNEWPAYTGVITVFPRNGTSVAISGNFAPQYLPNFEYIKVGVATVDSRRGVFYFVAGVGKADVESLVGVKAGDPSAPVSFLEVPGPADNSSDIDFLGYSSALDLFVVSCSLITTGIASVKVMPADGKGGADWATIYEWQAGVETDNELGNGALSEDGLTFYVALDAGANGDVQYFAFDLKARTLAGSFTVPDSQWPGLVTAEVVSC